MSSLIASSLCLLDIGVNYLIFNISYELEPLVVSFIGCFGYAGIVKNNKVYITLYIYLHVIISLYRILTIISIVSEHIKILPLLPISFIYQFLITMYIVRYMLSLELKHEKHEPITVVISD